MDEKKTGNTRYPYLLGVMVVLCIIVYGKVFGFGFIQGDDDYHIFRNGRVLDPTWDHLLFLWKTRLYMYIPATMTAWAGVMSLSEALIRLFGDSSAEVIRRGLFHGLGLLTHILNSLMVYKLCEKILGDLFGAREAAGRFDRRFGAAFAAGLFALHPLQVESVAWVSSFKGVFATFWALTAWLVFFGFQKAKVQLQVSKASAYYLLSLFLFGLSLFSKPSMVILPGMIWASEAICARSWRARLLLQLLPWFGLSLIFTLIQTELQPSGILPYGIPLYLRPWVATHAVSFYLSKIFLPVSLGIDYGKTPVRVISEPVQFLDWVALLIGVGALAGGFLYSRKRDASVGKALLIAGVLTGGALLPVLGLFPFGFQNISTVADRFIYAGIMGPALLFGGLSGGLRRYRALWALVVLTLAILTRSQVGHWANTETILVRSLDVNPTSAHLHNLRGIYFSDEFPEKPGLAIEEYKKAIQLNPSYPEARHNLATALIRLGDRQAAALSLREALRLKENWSEAHNTLALYLDEEGNSAEAELEFKKAIESNRWNAEAYSNFGAHLAKLGRDKEAYDQYQAALGVDPYHAEAINNLGLLMEKQGDTKGAIECYRKALREKNQFAEAHFNLAGALAKQGETTEAAKEYVQALSYKPNYPEAHNNLGTLFLEHGSPQEAEKHFARATQLNPKYANAHFNLGITLTRLGRFNDAIQSYLRALEIQRDFPQAHNNLGFALEKLGRRREARQHYLEATKLNPGFSTAKENLNRISKAR